MPTIKIWFFEISFLVDKDFGNVVKMFHFIKKKSEEWAKLQANDNCCGCTLYPPKQPDQKFASDLQKFPWNMPLEIRSVAALASFIVWLTIVWDSRSFTGSSDATLFHGHYNGAKSPTFKQNPAYDGPIFCYMECGTL